MIRIYTKNPCHDTSTYKESLTWYEYMKRIIVMIRIHTKNPCHDTSIYKEQPYNATFIQLIRRRGLWAWGTSYIYLRHMVHPCLPPDFDVWLEHKRASSIVSHLALGICWQYQCSPYVSNLGILTPYSYCHHVLPYTITAFLWCTHVHSLYFIFI